ncbi:MAG: cytochrome c-type biogenesis protein CcmH [Hyphomicrobiales bacterium]|nr:cytochrome c-type biogenesis protein CcmH [Hyphomicrobiales bacterium]PCJ95704.1 MAG: cytochrome c-type biogenesis protein CcmH [Hyphomicrobiales bacterium]
MRHLFVALWIALLSLPALAVEPDEVLADPVLESRARDLSTEVRCMVCQNQSIDSSDAPLAKDLRILVRERLTAGDSNEEVLSFLVARYGEFVLLKPRMSVGNAVLWFAPIAILLIGGGFAVFTLRRRKKLTKADVPLSDEEHAALKKILSQGD